VADPGRRRLMLVATTRAIAEIHAVVAARPVVVDDVLIDRWVTARVRIVADTLGRGSTASPASGQPAVASVGSRIAADLRDRTLQVGWIHGDLWPANVLVKGAGPAISGIVDWDSAEDDELALHDRLHLALTTRRLVERAELGPVVAGLLTGGGWTDDDRAVLDVPQGGRPLGDGPEPRPSPADGLSGLPDATALWLYWLRFVESNLTRRPGLATDRVWLAANVEQVLACA
jgi:phosphotransferase family enzyme